MQRLAVWVGLWGGSGPSHTPPDIRSGGSKLDRCVGVGAGVFSFAVVRYRQASHSPPPSLLIEGQLCARFLLTAAVFAVLQHAVLCDSAPFADIYRGMAMIGVQGFGALPKYCGVLMLVFFVSGEQGGMNLKRPLLFRTCCEQQWLWAGLTVGMPDKRWVSRGGLESNVLDAKGYEMTPRYLGPGCVTAAVGGHTWPSSGPMHSCTQSTQPHKCNPYRLLQQGHHLAPHLLLLLPLPLPLPLPAQVCC